MKFDIMKWHEVQANETYDAPKGRLHILCSKEAAVYVQAHGVEVLAGVGTQIDVTTAEDVTFTVEAPKGARIFVETPRSVFHKSDAERFTNDDRRPLESESVLEVRRALRQMQIEQAQMLREMRQEARKHKRKQNPDSDELPETSEAEQADETEATASE